MSIELTPISLSCDGKHEKGAGMMQKGKIECPSEEGRVDRVASALAFEEKQMYLEVASNKMGNILKQQAYLSSINHATFSPQPSERVRLSASTNQRGSSNPDRSYRSPLSWSHMAPWVLCLHRKGNEYMAYHGCGKAVAMPKTERK